MGLAGVQAVGHVDFLLFRRSGLHFHTGVVESGINQGLAQLAGRLVGERLIVDDGFLTDFPQPPVEPGG